MSELIVKVAGSADLRLSPGHYCGGSWGFGLYIENWMVEERFRTPTGYSLGGVLDFKDVAKIYKAAVAYNKKNRGFL